MKTILTTIFLLLFTAAIAMAGALNINTATSAELQTLSGIGSTKAQTIVDYRNAHGPFKTINDLTHVKGIGVKTLERLRNDITVDDK
ncbi:MAG: helix-hairpin-helix domain-containing protein [Desulfobulbaceae bacterium]|nr:helix-hairpin-helix domain-containing protein [Desulfobulbaceae bacterium]